MEKLQESWTFGPADFQGKVKKLDESAASKYIGNMKKLDESTDANSVIKAASKLKESLKDDKQIELLEKIISQLQESGADNSFKVWEIPVAKYDNKNLNNRIYPKKLWENIEKNQRDAWCGLCGLADHPERDDDPGKFRDQAVVWHDMNVGDDGVVYGVCSFVGPYGHLAQEILEHGGRIGTSSSGFGDVDPVTKIVDPDTYMVERLADLVLNPSQGTYGTATNAHVSPKDFTKNLDQAAVIDFTGNRPIEESVKPRSKIFMAKADAAAKHAEADDKKLNENTKEQSHSNINVGLSKVEEKAFRQYVQKFLDEAKNYDNPLTRLNECTEILSCFDEGNCPDLKESVEKQILDEKAKLEQLVESTTTLEKDYGMSTKEFREAAEKNTQKAILLNDQVIDLKSLLEESSKRNAMLKQQLKEANDKLSDQNKISESRNKRVNKNLVDSLRDNDELTESVALLKKKNTNLMEKISQLSLSNSRLEKQLGLYETKLKEAASLLRHGKRAKSSLNEDIAALQEKVGAYAETIRSLKTSNKQLNEAYKAQSEKFDALNEKYNKLNESLDPSAHMMKPASDRIGKYLNFRQDHGVEVDEYWNDLKENYGEAVLPYENEIRSSKTLKEATTRFLKHRNDIVKDFDGTEPMDYPFRNETERDRVYEQTGMLNPKQSYKEASNEEKSSYFLDKLHNQGLM